VDLGAALDLWREDTARAAARVDVTGKLADRVVAAAEQGRPPMTLVPAGTRVYAAAAVLLIAVGVAGTLMARQPAPEVDHAVRFADFVKTYVEVLADDPGYYPDLEGR
jgi:antirestriction protein ArdC